MLTAVLLALGALVAAAGAVYLVGEGDLRRGRLRSVRRIRTTRRRFVRPLLERVRLAAGLAWARPVRTDVAGQVRRLADRVERASTAADGFIRAQHGLSVTLGQLEDVAPRGWAPPPTPGARKPHEVSVGNGWLVALGLAAAGIAMAAANGWVLDRLVLPAIPDAGLLPHALVGSDLVAPVAAGLPFLLGIAYFTLNAGGKALGLRFLAAVAVLLAVVIGAAQAAAVILALEALGIATATWWGGIGVTTLLGGVAFLVPAIVAVLSHSAVERLDRWLAARDRRAASRAVARQDQLSGQLHATLDRLTAAVDSLRGEVVGLSSESAGRLLLHPGERPTVERAGAVLRRLAAAVEEGREGAPDGGPGPASVTFRVLGDLAAVATWFLTAAGALTIIVGALRHGAELGTTGLMTASAFAAAGALLAGGLCLRLVFSSPRLRLGPLARGAAVLLLGLAAVGLAAALGWLSAGAEGGLFEGRPLYAAAWLNVLVLVAALASIRLPEGIGAAGGIVTFLLAAAALLVLRLIDLALAAADRVLSGVRPRRRPAPRPRRPRPAVGALGGRREAH